MAKPGFSRGFNRARRASAARRNAVKSVIHVETLEGRALLSHLSHAHAIHTQITDQPALEVVPQNPHMLGPVYNIIRHGFASKIPRYYPFYNGTRAGNLLAAGAFGSLDGHGNAILKGIVVLPIIAAPTSANQEAFYAFGINDGHATSPGPFPNRPGIVFDYVAAVAIKQDGVHYTLTNVNTGVTTDLGSQNVTLGRFSVQVTVPLFLLANADTSLPGAGLSVNFWPRNAPANAGPQAITSFVPEFRNFPVSGNAGLVAVPG